jgi:hypothetical protein
LKEEVRLFSRASDGFEVALAFADNEISYLEVRLKFRGCPLKYGTYCIRAFVHGLAEFSQVYLVCIFYSYVIQDG